MSDNEISSGKRQDSNRIPAPNPLHRDGDVLPNYPWQAFFDTLLASIDKPFFEKVGFEVFTAGSNAPDYIDGDLSKYMEEATGVALPEDLVDKVYNFGLFSEIENFLPDGITFKSEMLFDYTVTGFTGDGVYATLYDLGREYLVLHEADEYIINMYRIRPPDSSADKDAVRTVLPYLVYRLIFNHDSRDNGFAWATPDPGTMKLHPTLVDRKHLLDGARIQLMQEAEAEALNEDGRFSDLEEYFMEFREDYLSKHMSREHLEAVRKYCNHKGMAKEDIPTLIDAYMLMCFGKK